MQVWQPQDARSVLCEPCLEELELRTCVLDPRVNGSPIWAVGDGEFVVGASRVVLDAQSAQRHAQHVTLKHVTRERHLPNVNVNLRGVPKFNISLCQN